MKLLKVRRIRPIRNALLASALLLQLASYGDVASAHPQRPESRGDAESSPAVRIASDYLMTRLRRGRPDIDRFELTAVGDATREADADVRVEIAPHPEHGSPLSRRACVWVRLTDANGRSHVVPVWFEVKAFRQALVLQRHLAAHEMPSEADFVLQEVDVAPLAAVPEIATETLAAMRARRSLSRGHILLGADLEPKPQILNGQQVEVSVRHGAIAIRTSAIALAEARTGEVVRLRNPDSLADYTARVTGEGQAEVGR